MLSLIPFVFGFGLNALAIPLSAGTVNSSLQRRSSETCGGFNGLAGFFDTASNFTLSTLNNTLPNSNGTGAPLTLGAVDGVGYAQTETLATFASVGSNDWPTFTMTGGTLFASKELDGSGSVHAVATSLKNSSAIIFSNVNGTVPENPSFCLIANTDPHGGGNPFPVVAVGNNADLFSFCQAGSQNRIVYNASAINDGSYDFTTCYSVAVIIQFLE